MPLSTASAAPPSCSPRPLVPTTSSRASSPAAPPSPNPAPRRCSAPAWPLWASFAAARRKPAALRPGLGEGWKFPRFPSSSILSAIIRKRSFLNFWPGWEGNSISRRRRESSSKSSRESCTFIKMGLPHDHIEGLRPRHCAEPSCNAVFAVCACCDRGQRYCSEPCRRRSRQAQLRAAGKRYQSTEEGKRAHGRRQQAYRERREEAAVTHQPMVPIISPSTFGAPILTQCAICGQYNPSIDAYHRLLPRPRRRRRSAKVQKTTFSDDR